MPTRPRWLLWSALAIAAVCVLYVASSGPVAWMLAKSGGAGSEMAASIYRPLRFVAGPDTMNRRYRAWHWYVCLWVHEDMLSDVGGPVTICDP